MSVIIAGSLNIDLVVGLDRMPNPGETVHGSSFETFPGGKGLNQAVAASRSSAKTSMIGVLGDDPYGRSLQEVLKAEGIDSRLVRSVSGPSGTAIIEVDSAGQNRIVVISGANAKLDASEVAISEFSAESILLAQLESPLTELSLLFHQAKSQGAFTILNPAPAIDLPESFLINVDILVPNQHEARILSGKATDSRKEAIAAAREILKQGVGAVVVTLGEEGAIYVSAEKEIFQSAFEVMPIDTTAAGDSFCGAFAAELDRGSSIADSLTYACAAGGLSTTKKGAVPSVPTELEIRSFMSSRI
jgi:ribokinase